MSAQRGQATPRADDRKPGAPRMLRFDRRFGHLGVPRLQCSSGTLDPAKFEALNRLLTDVAASEHAGLIIRALARGALKGADLAMGTTPRGIEGLAALAGKQVAALPAPAAPLMSAAAPGTERAPSTSNLELVGAELVTNLANLPDLQACFWTEALDRAIPSKRRLKPDTRRRYATSIRTLRARTGTYRISEGALRTLSNLTEIEIAALDRCRFLNLRIEEVRRLTRATKSELRTWLKGHKFRLGMDVFEDLKALGHADWEAADTGEGFIVASAAIQALQRMSTARRALLRTACAPFTATMATAALASVSEEDWDDIRDAWGGSPADWNHLKRGMTAVLSKIMGTTQNVFRTQIVGRLRFRREVEVLPDVTPVHFWEIVNQLPEAMRPCLIALTATGLRPGEYITLTRKDLRPATFEILIPQSKTEDGEDFISVDPRFWPDVLAAIPSPVSLRVLRQAVKAACDAAGHSSLRLHDLRHCHAQWASKQGVSEAQIQSQLRHTTPHMTRRYTRSKNTVVVARAAADVLMGSRVAAGVQPKAESVDKLPAVPGEE